MRVENVRIRPIVNKDQLRKGQLAYCDCKLVDDSRDEVIINFKLVESNDTADGYKIIFPEITKGRSVYLPNHQLRQKIHSVVVREYKSFLNLEKDVEYLQENHREDWSSV